MTAKRCPLCGGEPQFMEYAVPECQYPDGWDFGVFGLEPIVMFKRIECKDCKCTTPQLYMLVDEAVRGWNEGHVLEFIVNENITDVEPEET